MVILLTGFLGSGKSSIANILCQGLKNHTCIEMDDVILKKTNFSSITEAYNKNVSEWKEKELETSKELSKRTNIVVSTTAAFVENNLNLRYFKENANNLIIVYLKTKPTILTRRLVNLYDEFKKDGPQIVLKAMEKYYQKRDDLYMESADFMVNTEESTPYEAAQEILQKLNQRPFPRIFA